MNGGWWISLGTCLLGLRWEREVCQQLYPLVNAVIDVSYA